MSNNFVTLTTYVAALGLAIDSVDEADEMVIVSDLDEGINNLILDVEDDVLVMEQVLFTGDEEEMNCGYINRTLMQLNRELVHGAFASFYDDDGKIVYVWRDTLSLAGSFDAEELEASINALSLAMAEHGATIIMLFND